MKKTRNLEEFCTPLIQLQSLLADIQENEYDYYLSEIEKCNHISEEVLCQELLFIIPYRPAQIDTYMRLVSDLSKDNSRHCGFNNKLLHFVIYELNNCSCFKKNLSSFVFIRLCYNAGLYPISIIHDKIAEYIKKPSSYFFPHPLILIAFQDIFNNPLFDTNMQEIWYRNCYLLLDESPIIKAIRYDDIDTIRDIFSIPSFDPNMIIPGNVFSMYPLLRKPLSLIKFAAFYGSSTVFKFLFMEGHSILGISKYAILGGNLDIIHIVYQNDALDGKSYKHAIKYHRNEIFRWILFNQNNGCLPTDLKESLFDQAIKSNSIRIFIRVIDGINIEKIFDHKPLHKSCEYGFIGLTVIICKFFPMCNEYNEQGIYPIHKAVQNNHKHCIRVLIKAFPESGFQTSKSNTDVFLEALYICNLDICSLLASYDRFDMSLLVQEDNFQKLLTNIVSYDYFEAKVFFYGDISVSILRYNSSSHHHFFSQEYWISKKRIDLPKLHKDCFVEIFRRLMEIEGFNINIQNCRGNTLISLLSNRTREHQIIDVLCEDPNLNPMIENSQSDNIIMVLLNPINASLIPKIVNNHKYINLSKPEISRIYYFMMDLIKKDRNDLFLSFVYMNIIDVNIVLGSGDTFLHEAIKRKKRKIIEGLLNHPSCNYKVLNKEGISSYQMACESTNDIFEMFQNIDKQKTEKI